jgi:hypothetical protein
MNKTFGIAAFTILGAATWLVLSHSSFTEKINGWQASITGDNKIFPVLSIFILALPPLLLLLLIKMIILKGKRK